MATQNVANENYVNQRINAEIGSKEFMSIDPTNGQFMIPISKVGTTQRYMRLSIINLDGTWVPDLDQKQYTRNSDGTFTEVV